MTVEAPISGAGNLVKTDGGSLILNGGSTHTGETSLEAGSMTINSAISNTSTFRLRNDTTLNIGAGADISASRFVTSDSGGANSIVNQTGGTLTVTGTINNANQNSSFVLGHWGSGGADTVYNLSDGTINSLGAHLSFGWDGLVTMNQTGGTANLLALKLGNGRNNAATYNLDGGALNLGSDGIIANANKTVNLGGGTLGSLASWSTTQQLQLTGTVGDSSISPSAGHTIALNGGLAGAAGFSMDGAGTLELGGASTFAGNAVVNSGSFFLNGSMSSGLEIASGAALGTGTAAATGTGSVGSLTLNNGSSSSFRVGPSGDLMTVTATDGFTVQTGGTHSISITPAGQLFVNDEFTLFDYDGTIQGEGFSGLSLNALPNPHYAASLVDDSGNTSVNVRVDSIDAVVWTGANSASWDVETNQNFKLESDSSSSLFYTYDVVKFDDTASEFAVSLSGTITPASVEFDHSSNDYSLSGSGIGGVGSLTKDGSGTLTLLNDNSYTGNTTVNAGTLVIGDGTSGSIDVSSGVTIASGAELVLDSTSGSTINNNIANNGTLRISGSNDFTVSTVGGGVISGSGAMVYDGTGTLTLAGRNTVSGGLTVESGTVVLSGGGWYQPPSQGTGMTTVEAGATLVNWNSHSFGGSYSPNVDLTLDGGTFQIRNGTYVDDVTFIGGRIEQYAGGGGNVRMRGGGGSVLTVEDSSIQSEFAVQLDTSQGSSTWTVNDPDTDFLISGSIVGGNAVTKNGVGNVLATATDSTYSGALTIAQGTFTMGAGASLPASLVNVAAGAEFDVTAHAGGYAFSASQTISGTGTIDGVVTVAGTIAPGASPGTLNFDDDLGLNSAAILDFELNPTDMTLGGGVNDLLAIGGALTLDGLLNVTATSGDFSSASLGDTWTLATYSGSLVDNGLDFGSMPTLANDYEWEVNTSTPGAVNLTVIPEPRFMLLGSLGLLLILRRRRAA